MWVLDPEGVQRRKSKRLIRQKYSVPGPNFVWHIDGYDKLKPYGFGIHGAIDGFSRKVIWLEVGQTNNNPNVVAEYYLNAVKKFGIVPRIIRCDLGTENSTIKLLQPYFRMECDDEFSGMNSFMAGKSTSNQRIEAFWGMLRRQVCDFWINSFKDLCDQGLYSDGNPLHVECLIYCFMPVLKVELQNFANRWNVHNIALKKNADCPSGKPDIMFFTPEVYGSQSYGSQVVMADAETACQLYGKSNLDTYCLPEFRDLVENLKGNTNEPQNFDEGLKLYMELLVLFQQLDI